MTVFCDTSVLIASSLTSHPHHASARLVLERIIRGEDVGHCSAHTLAETYSVLLRMPTNPKLDSHDVLAILERNIFPNFVVIGLNPADYIEAIRAFAQTGLGGGRLYDLLHIKASSKVVLERVYTFNASEWLLLAPEMAELILEPSPNGVIPPADT